MLGDPDAVWSRSSAQRTSEQDSVQSRSTAASGSYVKLGNRPPSTSHYGGGGGGGGALTAAPPPIPVGLQGPAGNFRSAPLYFLNLAGQLQQVATAAEGGGSRGEVSERLQSRLVKRQVSGGAPPPCVSGAGDGGGASLDYSADSSAGGLSGLLVATPCDMADGDGPGMSLAISRGLMKIGSQNSERSDCGGGGGGGGAALINSRFSAAAAAVAASSSRQQPQQPPPASPRLLSVATPPSFARDLLRIGSQSSERSDTNTATSSGPLPRPPPPPPAFAVTSIPDAALMGRGSGGMMRPQPRRTSLSLLAVPPPPPAAHMHASGAAQNPAPGSVPIPKLRSPASPPLSLSAGNLLGSPRSRQR